jgi:glycerophosphoryl diester phosphodiesterase
MSAPGVVIAHRAGNDLDLLAFASRYADVVEADVHLYRGRLEVRHAKTLGPFPVLWERWYLLDRDTPRLLLEELLPAVGPDVDLMLDLKGPDPRITRQVIRAMSGWLAERRMLVCARMWSTVDRMRGVRGVVGIHSVGSPRQLRALLRRYGPDALDGVSIDCRLLTPGVVAALRERAPRVWSWPINDRVTAEVLAGWGVTGFITDAAHVLRPAGRSPREPASPGHGDARDDARVTGER